MPGVNIQAPSLKPPRVSILSSADVITISGDRWWGGIEYKKLSGNPGQGIDSAFDGDDSFILPICPVDSNNGAKQNWPRTLSDRVVPFAVYASEECSAFGIPAAELLDRAKQKLLVGEAWSIERELWFGTATTNFSFADAGSISLGTGLHPLEGFSEVDSAVARDRGDGRGMVHLTTRTFDYLQQYGLFRREGNVWLSPHDNIVVPGRGYGDADTPFIYGHPGIIQIVRSEVMTVPDTAEGLEATMNRRTNDLWVVAERVVSYVVPSALGTDGDNGVYSATVTLASALSSGGGGGGGDASAANQTTGNAILTEIETAVDGLEASFTTMDGRLANLEDTLTADAAALTNVADQDTNIQLLAANADRRGVIIHNDSPGILYLKYGATATTTGYTYKIAADGTWDMPMPIYTGQIDGIWTSSASGSARITELT
jgi:hypothetical protein